MPSRQSGTSENPILYYGKLPEHADFIRFNASGDTLRDFDQWIQEGLYLAQQRLGKQWDFIYRQLPMYNFLFNPQDTQSFLLGVFKPSWDRSGRKYPFLISKRFQNNYFDSRHIHLIPLLFSQFLHRSTAVLDDNIDNLSLDRITDSMDELQYRSGEDIESTLQSFQDFIQDTLLDNYLSYLFSDFDEQDRCLLFENLLNWLLPLKLQKSSRLNMGLRFVLSDNRYSIDKEACFWIYLCMQILGNPDIVPSFFWQIPAYSSRNYLFIYFKSLSPKAFLQLAQPDSDTEKIFKPEENMRSEPIQGDLGIFPEVRSLLKNLEINLVEFTEGMTRIGRKME